MTVLRCPTESEEQQALFEWAKFAECQYPSLKWLHAIPNGGLRHKATAARLKAEGVKAGVPDIDLPVAKGGYHGLRIEMKRRYGGRTSEDQDEWLEGLRENGYLTGVCKGWCEARDLILWYLGQA